MRVRGPRAVGHRAGRVVRVAHDRRITRITGGCVAIDRRRRGTRHRPPRHSLTTTTAAGRADHDRRAHDHDDPAAARHRPSLAEGPGKRPSVVVTPTGVVLPVLAVEGRRTAACAHGLRRRSPLFRPGPALRPRARRARPRSRRDGSRRRAKRRSGRATSTSMSRSEHELTSNPRASTSCCTREFDYYVPFVVRGELALNSSAALFVSIHHNSGGASLGSDPGTEVFYQQLDANSRRLAGLLWEDVTAALRVHPIQWYGAAGAGALFRQGRTGPDFYGVLRRTAGVPATLLEIAYLSNPREAGARRDRCVPRGIGGCDRARDRALLHDRRSRCRFHRAARRRSADDANRRHRRMRRTALRVTAFSKAWVDFRSEPAA